MTMTSESNAFKLQICRGCLNECNEYKSLFKIGLVIGETTTLSRLLTDLTGLEFTDDNELPKNLCSKCVKNLCKSYVFKQKVLKSQQTLKAIHDADSKNEQEIFEVYYLKDESGDEEDNSDEIIEFQEQNNIAAEYEIQIQNEYENNDDETEDIETVDYIGSSDEIDTNKEENCEIEQTSYLLQTKPEKPSSSDSEIVNTNREVNKTEEVITLTEKSKEDLIIKHLKTNQVPKRIRRAKSSNVEQELFKCEVCGKQLSNYSSHKYHMQLHSDVTPFLCSLCGEKFKTRNAYDGHMTTHDKDNPNICNFCGKTYRQPSSLRSHILTHTGEKPFVCGICGKGMTQKSGFKKHMLIHTGEKPFECDICQKKFRYSSNLNAHKKGHYERGFTCRLCEKQFSTNEQLKRHGVTHTQERRFSCNFCDKTFARRSTLMAHAQIHKEHHAKKKLNLVAVESISLQDDSCEKIAKKVNKKQTDDK